MSQSPLVGYNNNVRHKDRVFHVQTEDSGVHHPHIITHLFMDGGRILKSVKTSYAEHLGQHKLADLVRKLMKEQHKGMLLRLRAGEFDAVASGNAAPAPKAAAAPLPSPAAPTVSKPAAPPMPVRGTSPGMASVHQSDRFGELPPLPPPPERVLRHTPSPAANGTGRYAATEVSSVFGEAPLPAVSNEPDRSLDEVILGYLSEDLE